MNNKLLFKLALASGGLIYSLGCGGNSNGGTPQPPPKTPGKPSPATSANLGVFCQSRVFADEAGLQASVPPVEGATYEWEGDGHYIQLTGGQKNNVVTYSTLSNVTPRIEASEQPAAWIKATITTKEGKSITQKRHFHVVRNEFLKDVHTLFPRADHTATTLADGRILFTGGYNHDALRHTELYDPLTDTFAQVGHLQGARAGHTATLLQNGKVLVVGGYTLKRDPEKDPAMDGTAAIVYTSELYDPTSQSWTRLSTDPKKAITPRRHHAATLLQDGKVMVIGGQIWNKQKLEWLTSACLFDPATETWTTLQSAMPEPLVRPAAITLTNGQVMVMGRLGKSVKGYLYDTKASQPWKTMDLKNSGAEEVEKPVVPLTLLPLENNQVMAIGSGIFACYQNQQWKALENKANIFSQGTLLPNGSIFLVNSNGKMGLYKAGENEGNIKLFSDNIKLPQISHQSKMVAFRKGNKMMVLLPGCPHPSRLQSNEDREGNEDIRANTVLFDTTNGNIIDRSLLNQTILTSNNLILTTNDVETKTFDPQKKEWHFYSFSGQGKKKDSLGMKNCSLIQTATGAIAIDKNGGAEGNKIKTFSTEARDKKWEELTIKGLQAVALAQHSAIALPTGKILITGMASKEGTFLLDYKEKSCERFKAAPFKATQPMLTLVKKDNKDQVLAVSTSTGLDNVIAYYDLARNEWGQPVATQGAPLIDHVVYINGHVLGCPYANKASQVKKSKIYQLNNDTWIPLENEGVYWVTPLHNGNTLCSGWQTSAILDTKTPGYLGFFAPKNIPTAPLQCDRIGYKTLCIPCGKVQEQQDSKVILWGGSPGNMVEYYKPEMQR